jgi:pimeloyl-ACP methyl ester carboxylesterase
MILSSLRGFPPFEGFFSHCLPLAGKLGARMVALNRRDYPRSEPFSEEDHALLLSTTDKSPAAFENADRYMKARAREFYDFLSQLVKSEDLPINSIIFAGWSLGTLFVTSFLVHAPSFDSQDASLSQYIRRVILYGAYPSPRIQLQWKGFLDVNATFPRPPIHDNGLPCPGWRLLPIK